MAMRFVAIVGLAMLPAGCALPSGDRAAPVASVRPADPQPAGTVTGPPTTTPGAAEQETTTITAATPSSASSPPVAQAASPSPADAGSPPRSAPAPAPARMPARSGEVLPDAKQLASDIARRLVTYDPSSSLAQIVASITTDPARQQALAVSARPLYHPGTWSEGAVVYPQLGGFRSEHASVMVVVRQETGTTASPSSGSVESTETRTLDVRLARVGGIWAFEALASTGGEPVPRPAKLAPQAVAVLDNPRIELPDSARWDIYRGEVAPALLRVMAEMAERTPFGVVVLSSGHPHNVFGTNRQSNHTRGRAVDVYLVGGTRVADDRTPDSAAYHLAHWLLQRTGLSELGSPWRLGPGSFTDTVHQDHLHIAVTH